MHRYIRVFATYICNNAGMDWDDVRIFLAVAREGSFSGAAKALKVNHTTVSRRITSFEQKLQVRLFDRLSSGGLATTTEAEGILEHAQEMEVQAQAMDRQLMGRNAKLDGKLRVTMPDVVAQLLMPRMTEFQQQYPDIELEFITTYTPLNLGAREADIAVRVTETPPEYLIGKRIAKLRHGIYATADYLEKFPDLNHPDARALAWLNDPGRPPWVQDFFPNITMGARFDTGTGLTHAVASHLGVSRLTCFDADSFKQLYRLPIDLPLSNWGVWILSHVDLRATARVRVFREFLSEALGDLKPLIEGEQSKYQIK
jgi:DNA-binding transcriptional LysR family regulator